MPRPALPASNNSVATRPARRGNRSTKAIRRSGGSSRTWWRDLAEDDAGRRSRARKPAAAPRTASIKPVCCLGDRDDRARRPPPSITRARQPLLRAHLTARPCRAGRSRSPRVAREFPKQHAPRRPSAHAPPALTFGLPGKQRVNSVASGPDFACFDKALVSNVRIFVTLEPLPPQIGGFSLASAARRSQSGL